ncbi:hypothetical protein T11_7738 [Trichinella zimbabwensis]|uniref:Uncharacterized protein n=1 Tax=Trichinella zimbabwensis TaxID=268475 RepID=A0A0V1HNH0_9BILA|nr:hypothetical protein T11_7738 [Trichinella zimbabwensis]
MTSNVPFINEKFTFGYRFTRSYNHNGTFQCWMVNGEFTFASAVYVLMMEIYADNINIALLKADLEATFPRVKMLLSRDICSRCFAKYFSSATVELIDWRASLIDLVE